MARTLTVVFGSGKEYDFTIGTDELAAVTEDAAWRWFDREYTELDCQASSPVGKVLVIDKILNVAKFSGEARFSAILPGRRTLPAMRRGCWTGTRSASMSATPPSGSEARARQQNG